MKIAVLYAIFIITVYYTNTNAKFQKTLVFQNTCFKENNNMAAEKISQ